MLLFNLTETLLLFNLTEALALASRRTFFHRIICKKVMSLTTRVVVGGQGRGVRGIIDWFKSFFKAADDNVPEIGPTTKALAAAASAAASATAAKATASAAAAAAVANPSSAAALLATAAAARAEVIASTAAEKAAEAARGVPDLVTRSVTAAAASDANPQDEDLKRDSTTAAAAVSKAVLVAAAAADAAAGAAAVAAAAHAQVNASAPPDLETGVGFISCNGCLSCRTRIEPVVADVVKCILGVMILGALAFVLMKIVFEGKNLFGKKNYLFDGKKV